MKKLLSVSFFLFLVASALLAGLQLFVLTPEAVREEALRQIRRGFSGNVKLGGAKITWLTHVAVKDLVLSDTEGQEVFLSLRSAGLSLDWLKLLQGQVRFTELGIDGLELGLKRVMNGKFTFERFLTGKHASLRMPRMPRGVLLSAAAGAEATAPAQPETVGLGIDRIVIHGSRINYLDGFLPLQIHQIAGSLTLEPEKLEIRELRGRAFDRFVLSMRGSAQLPGPGHELVIRLDESPIKPLLSFIPPLNLMLTIAREQIEGWLGLSIETRADPHGEDAHVSLRFRDLKWTSRALASTIQAPEAMIKFTAKGSGDAARIEGDASLTAPMVRPNSFTQDIPMQDLTLNFDYGRYFARVRGYNGRFAKGTISGAGFVSWQTRKPDYELSFGISGVPLAALGMGGPDAAAVAKELRLTAKGRVLPNAIQLSSGELALAASKLAGQAMLLPDGDTWTVRDGSARLEMDGADLTRLLGLTGGVLLKGRLDGLLYPQGPLGQLRGQGRLSRTGFTLITGTADPIPIALEESPIELSGSQVIFPELRGALLGGRLAAQLAFSNQSWSPSGARMNFELSNLDAVSLVRALGAPGLVSSGRVTVGGLIGSRVNVGSGPGGPPEPAPSGSWGSGSLIASLGEATGLNGMLGSSPSPRPSPAPVPTPTGPPAPILTGTVEALDVVADSPAVKALLAPAKLTELKLARITARMVWEPLGLTLAGINGTGASGELTGELVLEAGARIHGKLLLVGRGGSVPLVVGAPPPK